MLNTLKEYIWVFFISMLPIVELRGAVPVGVTSGLPFWNTYLVAAFGNMLPVPVILLLVKPTLLFMQKIKIFKFLYVWSVSKHKHSDFSLIQLYKTHFLYCNF